jgi:hypothetical protein
MMAMLGIYYTDTWGAKGQPFMSTQLRAQSGKKYPISKVFVGGVLDEEALQKYGIPRLTGSFAYALFMANAAVRYTPDQIHCCVALLIPSIDWSSHRSHRVILGR